MALPDVAQLITYDERLRMVPTDPPALERAVEALWSMLDPARDAGQELAILRRIGVGLIALGGAGQAVPVLERAVAVAVATPDPRAEVAARVNLGDGHRYVGALAAAQEQYGSALALARLSVPELVDFALQHLGKALIELGRHEEATTCLTEALRLRREKGDPALVESTTAALKRARRAALGGLPGDLAP